MLYRADPPRDLRIVPLDTLTAIYQRRSGQTHVVAEPVPQIVAALQQGAASRETLLELLGIESDAHDLLSLRLQELEAVGLISRA